MINCLFYSILLSMFLTLSFGSLRYSQINRTFLSIYKGMFEASVITVDDDGNSIVPYFNEKMIEKYVVTYLDANIEKYVKDYTFEITYLNKDTYELCSAECRAIKLSLSAEINMFFDYKHEEIFIIKTRDEYVR